MLPSLSPAEYFPIRGTPSQGEAWRQFREFLGDPLGGAPNERGGPVVQADVGRAAAAARLLLASPWLGAREAPPSIATLAQTGDLSGTTIRNLLSAAVSSGLLLRASLPGGAGLLVVQPTQDGRDLLDRAAGRWRQASAGLGVALRAEDGPASRIVPFLDWILRLARTLQRHDRRYFTRCYPLLLWELEAEPDCQANARSFIVRTAGRFHISQQTVRMRLELAQTSGLLTWNRTLNLTEAGGEWLQTMRQAILATLAEPGLARHG